MTHPQSYPEGSEALRLLAAEDARQSKLHDLLETIREQIRLEIKPEHRPDGLFQNIQDAVYAMRGRMPLLNDVAITAPLSPGVAQCARCAIADTWGVPDYPRACVNCGKVAPASVSRGAYLCKEDHPDQDMYACTIDMTYDEAMDEIRRLGGRIADRIRHIEALEAKLFALSSTEGKSHA